jgi:hypothetical protein
MNGTPVARKLALKMCLRQAEPFKVIGNAMVAQWRIGREWAHLAEWAR